MKQFFLYGPVTIDRSLIPPCNSQWFTGIIPIFSPLPVTQTDFWLTLTLYVFQATSCWHTSSLGSWSAAGRPGSWWSPPWPTTSAGSVSTTFTARGATTVGWHTARASWPTCCLPESWRAGSKVHRTTQSTVETVETHGTAVNNTQPGIMFPVNMFEL